MTNANTYLIAKHRTLISNDHLEVTYTHRSRDSHMGRFGGGWQWAVGFQAGRTTIIVNMLVASIRIRRKKP